MVLCTVPLRGGSHVSEAAEGSLLSLVGSGYDPYVDGPATITATFVAFDLSAFPAIKSYTPAASEAFLGASCPFGNPSTGGECFLADSLGSLAVCTHVGTPPCVGCWSGAGRPGVRVSGLEMGADLSPLPAALLPSWSVPIALGTSASWSPGVEVAHCDKCAVTLVAGAAAPVSVAGDETNGWTITRSGAGTTVLDLLVGDFKVGEVTVTEAAGNPDTTPDTTPNPPVETTTTGYLEATVGVNGRTQRLRVYNPNNVLPADTTFTAEYVDGTHGDHNFFITHTDPTSDVELRHYYNLTLASGGQTLSQLDGPVELWFEAIDGIDAPDAFISRVAEGADAKLEPTLYTDDDGITWIKVLTDHFSPYALTDLLSAEEKAALRDVKTGDLAAQITVAGLGMTLVLALGIMLRLITSTRKFEE